MLNEAYVDDEAIVASCPPIPEKTCDAEAASKNEDVQDKGLYLNCLRFENEINGTVRSVELCS